MILAKQRRIDVCGLDENALVQLAIDQPAAFEELVRRHQKLVYNVLYQMVRSHEQAADLTQETFLRVYRGLKSFRKDAKFKPWLLKIATNACLNHIRDSKDADSLDQLLDENPLAEPAASDDVERTAELRITQTLLNEAMQELTARQRQAFVLRYVHDLPYEEIGAVLEVPISTVKPLLFRIREQLKKLLASHSTNSVEKG